MMDWSTNDDTVNYPGTFITRSRDYDTGIYVLDEASKESDPYTTHKVPIRAYDMSVGKYGNAARRPESHTIVKENFNGSGTPYSNRSNGNLQRVFENDWDERPMHYNPNAGADWAHLVPPRCSRPYGGGPAPSLAFPILSQSEGLNNPWAAVPALTGIPGRRDCFTTVPMPQPVAVPQPVVVPQPVAVQPVQQPVAQSNPGLFSFNESNVKLLLLFVLLILAAMSISKSNRLEKKIKQLTKMIPTSAVAAAG